MLLASNSLGRFHTVLILFYNCTCKSVICLVTNTLFRVHHGDLRVNHMVSRVSCFLSFALSSGSRNCVATRIQEVRAKAATARCISQTFGIA